MGQLSFLVAMVCFVIGSGATVPASLTTFIRTGRHPCSNKGVGSDWQTPV